MSIDHTLSCTIFRDPFPFRDSAPWRWLCYRYTYVNVTLYLEKIIVVTAVNVGCGNN